MRLNFLVLGSGLQGSAAASILSRSKYAEKIYLVDIDADQLYKVVKKIGSDKVIPIARDVRKIELEDDIDVILNFLPPSLNEYVMRLALKIKAYYVDTASGPDIRLRPVDENVLNQFRFDKDFQAKGICGIISSGATPGLTNIYAKKLYLDSGGFKELRLVAATYTEAPPKVLEPVAPYMEILFGGWNLETAFLYRATPPVVYKGNRYIRMEPFSNPEYYDFGRPIGRLLTVLVDHEEPVTLPKYIDVEYVEYRNLPDYMAYGLLKYGFGDVDGEIDVNGVKVKPFEVLRRLFPKPSNLFLVDTYQEDVGGIDLERILIIGSNKGGTIKGILDMEVPPRSRRVRKIFYERFGTTYIYVALPAIVSGILAIEENLVGIHSPEYFNPESYIRKLKEFGYEPRFRISST